MGNRWIDRVWGRRRREPVAPQSTDIAALMEVSTTEAGSEGLQRWNGQVSETYLSKLQWPGAYAVYDEMRRRDPTLRSVLNAVRLLSRQAVWTVEPGGDTDDDRDAAKFLESCLEDMSHTVSDFVDDVLTFLPFGWASAEIVYKRRPDGRIGWRKLAPRRQSTLARWEFDAEGGLQGWYQSAAPEYREVYLPIEKLLHFVAERDGNNPEGLSLFESAYEPWYFVKNLQIISGIGWQRAFVGLPVFEYEERPSDADKAAVAAIAKGLHVGAQQYVSVPPKVRFRLETVTNSNAGELLNTIRMYRVMMTQMVLADFIWLGAGESGSWSLGSDKSALFLIAVNGYLDRIAAVWNRYGVSRLFDVNDFSVSERPRIVHSDARKFRLGELGAFISQIAQYIPLYDSDATWLRTQAGLPAPSGEPLALEADSTESADPLGVWQYPTEREPVRARAHMVAFAQADYAHEDERLTLEEKLAQAMRQFLTNQRARIEQLASTGFNPGDDADFWANEAELLRTSLLQQLVSTIDALASMAIASVESDFAGGADWALVNADAARWAREQVGDLIGGITETTRAAVRETVATWIESGGELPDLQKMLARIFSDSRAELIATTEVTRAFDEANDLVRQRVGLPAATVHAPAHPRCRCYTRPIYVPGTGWLIVWNTVRDEIVCTQPLDMPWGTVEGCRGMHGTIVGGPDELVGHPLSEVRNAN